MFAGFSTKEKTALWVLLVAFLLGILATLVGQWFYKLRSSSSPNATPPPKLVKEHRTIKTKKGWTVRFWKWKLA
jgi:hypothetical protein